MVGGDASKSVSEGGVGYFVKNGQIFAESRSFFRPFLNCLLNPSLAIVIFDFSNFNTAHDGVDYVKNGWFELWVMGAGG